MDARPLTSIERDDVAEALRRLPDRRPATGRPAAPLLGAQLEYRGTAGGLTYIWDGGSLTPIEYQFATAGVHFVRSYMYLRFTKFVETAPANDDIVTISLVPMPIGPVGTFAAYPPSYRAAQFRNGQLGDFEFVVVLNWWVHVTAAPAVVQVRIDRNLAGHVDDPVLGPREFLQFVLAGQDWSHPMRPDAPGMPCVRGTPGQLIVIGPGGEVEGTSEVAIRSPIVIPGSSSSPADIGTAFQVDVGSGINMAYGAGSY